MSENIYPGEPVWAYTLSASTPAKLRKRDEMMKKAKVTEAIEALFGTMFSVAYAEINRIEDQYPWFDEEENKGGLDFDFFYTIIVKSLEHLTKNKSLEEKCAIADLVFNDLTEISGLNVPKSIHEMLSSPEIPDNSEGEKNAVSLTQTINREKND